MSQNIPEVQNTSFVNSAEFVRMIVYTSNQKIPFGSITPNLTLAISDSGNANWSSVGSPTNNINQFFTSTANGNASFSGNCYLAQQLTFSSSFQPETINNETYTPLSGLLSIGPLQNDIKVTSADTIIAVSGIAGNNIATVLNNNVRGSFVELYRGFYNSNYQLANVYLRFTGIVTNYAIQEDRTNLDDNFTVSLTASSFKVILDGRIAGRKTNQAAWQYFYPNDTSMNDVQSLAGVTFAFGGSPGSVSTLPGAGSSTGNAGGSGTSTVRLTNNIPAPIIRGWHGQNVSNANVSIGG